MSLAKDNTMSITMTSISGPVGKLHLERLISDEVNAAFGLRTWP